MKTGEWKITYTLEGVPTYPEELSEATIKHVSELVAEYYNGGEINEPEEGEFV
jgi:hypothetical protein